MRDLGDSRKPLHKYFTILARVMHIDCNLNDVELQAISRSSTDV